MADQVLSQEWKTYLENKSQLLNQGKGKYVLIKQDKILDLFDSQEDAIKEGYLRLGLVPFLAHRVTEQEEQMLFLNVVEE